MHRSPDTAGWKALLFSMSAFPCSYGDTEGNFEGHRIDVIALNLLENVRAVSYGNNELSEHMESTGRFLVELIRVRIGARAHET
jgi:hypothetical protein